MSLSIARQLVLKDLHLTRWIVVASLLSGLASIAIMPLGTVPAYVGGVSLICIVVILNIMLVTTSVVQERKDHVLLFVLSLPISARHYVAAKMAGNALAFAGTWAILTAAAVATFDATALPNGLLPFLLTVLGYLFFYYCVLLAAGIVTDSGGWHAAVIIAGNVSINFLIPLLLSLPSIAAHRAGETAVWSGGLVTLLALEVAAGPAVALAAYYWRARAADFL